MKFKTRTRIFFCVSPLLLVMTVTSTPCSLSEMVCGHGKSSGRGVINRKGFIQEIKNIDTALNTNYNQTKGSPWIMVRMREWLNLWIKRTHPFDKSLSLIDVINFSEWMKGKVQWIRCECGGGTQALKKSKLYQQMFPMKRW